MLDDLGLAEALTREAERFALRSGLPCQVEVGRPPEDIPPEVATAAFRIFQEALTNVARHAGAARVTASCRATADALELVVTTARGCPMVPHRIGRPPACWACANGPGCPAAGSCSSAAGPAAPK